MDPYRNQKGLTILTTVLIVAAILVLGAGIWIASSRIDDTAKQYVLVVEDDVLLTHSTVKYARGEKTDLETGKKSPVFYMLSGGKWQEIILEDGIISCEKMDRFGFPSSFISDCILLYPKAKTVAEVVNDISTGGGSGEVDIIGQIDFGSDPSCSTCFNISSGGSDLDLDLNLDLGNSDGYTPGDNVIITTIVDDGNLIVVDIINIDNNNNDDNNDDSNALDDKDLREEIYYDITDLPPGVLTEDYYKWLYDIDNSDIDVQIISDF